MSAGAFEMILMRFVSGHRPDGNKYLPRLIETQADYLYDGPPLRTRGRREVHTRASRKSMNLTRHTSVRTTATPTSVAPEVPVSQVRRREVSMTVTMMPPCPLSASNRLTVMHHSVLHLTTRPRPRPRVRRLVGRTNPVHSPQWSPRLVLLPPA